MLSDWRCPNTGIYAKQENNMIYLQWEGSLQPQLERESNNCDCKHELVIRANLSRGHLILLQSILVILLLTQEGNAHTISETDSAT